MLKNTLYGGLVGDSERLFSGRIIKQSHPHVFQGKGTARGPEIIFAIQ